MFSAVRAAACSASASASASVAGAATVAGSGAVAGAAASVAGAGAAAPVISQIVGTRRRRSAHRRIRSGSSHARSCPASGSPATAAVMASTRSSPG